ncbi:MAG: hypothetical protein JXA13_17440 [Anaerolineales bacterium]|nr:hypothetical protein [Anaerolineales bacterium]
MIPANEWWLVMQNYSQAVFPAQIFFYLAALVILVWSCWRPGTFTSQLVKGFFSLAFGWIGLVFFLRLGTDLPAHKAQAFLFLSLAVLFALDLATKTTRFVLPPAGWRRTFTLTGFAVVMLAYPLAGLLSGRPPARWIIPGSYPCPTTALALVFMAAALPVKRRWLYLVSLALLLVWAIPFPLMIQIPKFGVYEDGIMLASGLYSLGMLAINRRSS